MTKDEALRMALVALEYHSPIKHPQQIHYRDAAIAALKEVLAQEEPVENQTAKLLVPNGYKLVKIPFGWQLCSIPEDS